ncbi:hypothetical protein AS030_01380 [Fictibacillus enclensis]|uniref:Uncharacterized protein n=1 Tax=Fictibacillus enclensis TaxID=1017270 RepID=A0A0V8JB61_9BACL|nr:hypothetical protein AS030_01380 [Fictibacillus enclensis]
MQKKLNGFLIQRGGGTGPLKPRQRVSGKRKYCANSVKQLAWEIRREALIIISWPLLVFTRRGFFCWSSLKGEHTIDSI